MAELYDVLGIGVCAFDLVVEVDRYPGPDEKARALRIRQQGGGLIGTALVAVARLGGRCAYLGALGEDAFGDFCVRDFEREGVDTKLIRRVPGGSVVTAVIVADRSAGTRMIVWTDEMWPHLRPEDVTEAVVARTRVLHLDNFQPEAAIRAASLARQLGIPVTMDLEWAAEGTDELLALGDYVIVPLEFAQKRYGQQDIQTSAQALFDEVARGGGRAAVVTDGVRGSAAVWKGGMLRQPAYRVEVVDTTGCGDVFHGAFALGLARGWPIERIMPFASAVAALKCRQLGGRAGIPRQAEVEDFLRHAEPIG